MTLTIADSLISKATALINPEKSILGARIVELALLTFAKKCLPQPNCSGSARF